MARWTRAASAALPLALAAVALTAPPAAASASPVVMTYRGAVGGAVSGGVERFLGIPYAAPPTGALRWTAPQPAAAWSGVRDATRFGNPCPVLPSTNGPRSETDDRTPPCKRSQNRPPVTSAASGPARAAMFPRSLTAPAPNPA